MPGSNGKDAMDAKEARLIVNGVEYTIPPMTDWTLAEAEIVEDILGHPVEQANPRSKRTIRALVWLAMHRVDDQVTPQELGDIRLGDLSEVAAVLEPEEVVQVPPAVGGAHESQNGSAHSSEDDSDLVTHPPVPGHRLSAVSTD